MQQIKNYLSQIQNVRSILLLASTEEFEELEAWLKHTKKGQKIYRQLPEDGDIDMIIFDVHYSKQLLSLPITECKYIIGKTEKEEDYFSLWEGCRNRTAFIYIERDKGLLPKEVTADRAACEILFWCGAKTDIELSIVIPVYNVAKYLPQCIESLIKWKAPYVEYLFVNDGSTDNSEEIISNYAKQDQRIRLINKVNGGCASARNRGLEEARGRYIGFVDSDDFVEETMFCRLLGRALMGDYDLAYCGYAEYNEDTGAAVPVLNDCLGEPYREGTYRADKVQLLTVKTRVALWRCIYKKEILQQAGIRFYEEIKRFDDLPFRVEAIFAAKSAVCVPEHLYYYRLGRQGQDVACRDKRLFVHFPIFERLDKYVDNLKDSRLQDLLQIVKIQTHGYALSRIEKQYKKEYIRLAKKQLDRNMGYLRTLCLILMYTGKGNIGWYTRMKI